MGGSRNLFSSQPGMVRDSEGDTVEKHGRRRKKRE